MSFGNIVNQLHNHDRLAHSRSSEGSRFAPLGERTNKIDYLDPGLQYLGLRILLDQSRSPTMNRVSLDRGDRPPLVHRFP